MRLKALSGNELRILYTNLQAKADKTAADKRTITRLQNEWARRIEMTRPRSK